jgi:hypothetical protein
MKRNDLSRGTFTTVANLLMNNTTTGAAREREKKGCKGEARRVEIGIYLLNHKCDSGLYYCIIVCRNVPSILMREIFHDTPG